MSGMIGPCCGAGEQGHYPHVAIHEMFVSLAPWASRFNGCCEQGNWCNPCNSWQVFGKCPAILSPDHAYRRSDGSMVAGHVRGRSSLLVDADVMVDRAEAFSQ